MVQVRCDRLPAERQEALSDYETIRLLLVDERAEALLADMVESLEQQRDAALEDAANARRSSTEHHTMFEVCLERARNAERERDNIKSAVYDRAKIIEMQLADKDALAERVRVLTEQLRLSVIALENACAIRDAGHAIPPDAIWYEGVYFTVLRGKEALAAAAERQEACDDTD